MPEPDLGQLYEQVRGEVADALVQMGWAEEEVARARRRHPAEGDALYHSFGLLKPTHALMATEFVYRAHCRELLARVVSGADTRFGTAAEMCCTLCDASLAGPLTPTATGLYFRMWSVAYPDKPVTDLGEHYEALHRSAIDDLEAETRRKLTVATRTLTTITCTGRHHGEVVLCKYAEVTDD